MSDLFADHIARHERLDHMANDLLRMASLLDLHAWYKSNAVLADAAELAEEAAQILLGKRLPKDDQRGRVDPTPAGTTGIAPAGDLDVSEAP